MANGDTAASRTERPMLPRSTWGVRHWCRQRAEPSRRERVTARTTALDDLGERSRNSERHPAPTAQVRVTVGLTAIRTRLQEAEPAAADNHGDGQSARRAPRAQTAGLDLQTIEDHDERPAGLGYITYPGRGSGDRQASVWEAIQHGRPLPDEDTQQALGLTGEDNGEWRLIDVRTNGVWLERTGEKAAAASVAQLVLLSRTPDGSARRCYLGIIRRMRSVTRNRFPIGAEVFAHQPRPAKVRRLPANPNREWNREQTPAEAGLLLSRLRKASQRAALLLPAYMFPQGNNLKSRLANRRGAVRSKTSVNPRPVSRNSTWARCPNSRRAVPSARVAAQVTPGWTNATTGVCDTSVAPLPAYGWHAHGERD